MESVEGQKSASKDEAEAHALENQLQLIRDSQDAVERMVIEASVQSLEGAMVQVMVAGSIAGMSAASDYVEEGGHKANMEQIAKALCSVLAAIENACGADRDDFGGEYYMPHDLDPHAVAASAAASTAPVAEDPIVGLWRELLAHRASAEDDNKWLEVEVEILQMDALTAEGWAIQAELLAEQVDSRPDRVDERVAKRIAQHLRRMADAEQLAGRRVITSETDPVLTLCEKHLKAWTLVHSLDVKDSPGSDAFNAAEKIDLEIANTTATTIDGVLRQARLMSQWAESAEDGDWPDGRMVMIKHFILKGLKFVVRDDYRESDLGGKAVKE